MHGHIGNLGRSGLCGRQGVDRRAGSLNRFASEAPPAYHHADRARRRSAEARPDQRDLLQGRRSARIANSQRLARRTSWTRSTSKSHPATVIPSHRGTASRRARTALRPRRTPGERRVADTETSNDFSFAQTGPARPGAGKDGVFALSACDRRARRRPVRHRRSARAPGHRAAASRACRPCLRRPVSAARSRRPSPAAASRAA